MNSIEEKLVRNMIRHIFVVAHEGEIDLSDHTRQLLSGMTPLEIERIVELCRFNIRLDFDAMVQNIRRIRSHGLMAELVKAGASNQLLAELFGVGGRELSRLRSDAGAARPSRRSLNDQEEILVLERHGRLPAPRDSSWTLAIWTLDAARELELPYMAVYRCLAGMSETAGEEQ